MSDNDLPSLMNFMISTYGRDSVESEIKKAKRKPAGRPAGRPAGKRKPLSGTIASMSLLYFLAVEGECNGKDVSNTCRRLIQRSGSPMNVKTLRRLYTEGKRQVADLDAHIVNIPLPGRPSVAVADVVFPVKKRLIDHK